MLEAKEVKTRPIVPDRRYLADAFGDLGARKSKNNCDRPDGNRTAGTLRKSRGPFSSVRSFSAPVIARL